MLGNGEHPLSNAFLCPDFKARWGIGALQEYQVDLYWPFKKKSLIFLLYFLGKIVSARERKSRK